MDRLRAVFGYEAAQEPAPENPSLLQQWQTDIGEASKLTLQQRMGGFGICVAMTIVFWSLGSFSLMAFRISSFIFMFTLGNITALAGTCFLVGPKKQLENMSQRDRLASAITFVAAMVGTLVASIHFSSYVSTFIIVIPCLLVQLAALLWYCLTYIPGGQAMLMRLIGRAEAAGESMV